MHRSEHNDPIEIRQTGRCGNSGSTNERLEIGASAGDAFVNAEKGSINFGTIKRVTSGKYDTMIHILGTKFIRFSK